MDTKEVTEELFNDTVSDLFRMAAEIVDMDTGGLTGLQSSSEKVAQAVALSKVATYQAAKLSQKDIHSSTKYYNVLSMARNAVMDSITVATGAERLKSVQNMIANVAKVVNNSPSENDGGSFINDYLGTIFKG